MGIELLVAWKFAYVNIKKVTIFLVKVTQIQVPGNCSFSFKVSLYKTCDG